MILVHFGGEVLILIFIIDYCNARSAIFFRITGLGTITFLYDHGDYEGTLLGAFKMHGFKQQITAFFKFL